jgi:hypothetical protein
MFFRIILVFWHNRSPGQKLAQLFNTVTEYFSNSCEGLNHQQPDNSVSLPFSDRHVHQNKECAILKSQQPGSAVNPSKGGRLSKQNLIRRVYGTAIWQLVAAGQTRD